MIKYKSKGKHMKPYPYYILIRYSVKQMQGWGFMKFCMYTFPFFQSKHFKSLIFFTWDCFKQMPAFNHTLFSFLSELWLQNWTQVQKEVITYHFLSVFANSFSYSCSRWDGAGFQKLKPHGMGWMCNSHMVSIAAIWIGLAEWTL